MIRLSFAYRAALLLAFGLATKPVDTFADDLPAEQAKAQAIVDRHVRKVEITDPVLEVAAVGRGLVFELLERSDRLRQYGLMLGRDVTIGSDGSLVPNTGIGGIARRRGQAAGATVVLEQIQAIKVELDKTLLKQRLLTHEGVWQRMNERERELCERQMPDFTRTASGVFGRELATVDEELAVDRRNAKAHISRARLVAEQDLLYLALHHLSLAIKHGEEADRDDALKLQKEFAKKLRQRN